jgi:hypothetical protein
LTRALTIGAVGLLGGLIGAAVTTWLTPAVQPRLAASAELGALRAQVDALSRGNNRAAARLARLEANGPAAPQAPAPAEPSVPMAPEPEESPPQRPSAEERHQEQAKLLAAHAAEPVDRAWAAQTGAELDRALNELGHPGKMEITSLECRSQTCLAHLQWPSRQEAFDVRRSVQSLNSDLPCERRLYLGDDGENAKGYEGTLLLTCSR